MDGSAIPAFCRACGAESAGHRFCLTCGADANQTGAVSAPPASAQGGARFGTPYGPQCEVCGGDGASLDPAKVVCPHCRWLRPLDPSYELPLDAFLWRLDGEAMMRLRSLGPVTSMVHHITERYGRPWFEASVNGVRLSERQVPDIYATAVDMARIVGLPRMPEIYVSGEQMWECKTLGTDSYAFIVIGSVLATLKGDDLAFLLAREMGRVRAGHAVWRTAFELLMGRRHPQQTIMGDGVLKLLNPGKIVESAFEAPLMAWARHSEITADRAGQLSVGKLDVARRVLLQSTLRSFPFYQRIDQDDWRAQEDESDDAMLATVEATMSATPFIARRLKLAREFHDSEALRGWRATISHWVGEDRRLRPRTPREAPAKNAAAPQTADTVRLVCVSCSEPMRVARAQLVGDKPVNVRCPNPACGKILAVTPRRPPAPRPDQTSE